MCDFATLTGLAMGGLQAVGAARTARKNRKIIEQQTRLEHAEAARKRIVQHEASRKDAFKASQTNERTKATGIAKSGIRGVTSGERISEQNRQAALSISNARDRAEAANANYAFGSTSSSIEGANRIATEATYSPIRAFTTIASSGISNYGAFG